MDEDHKEEGITMMRMTMRRRTRRKRITKSKGNGTREGLGDLEEDQAEKEDQVE